MNFSSACAHFLSAISEIRVRSSHKRSSASRQNQLYKQYVLDQTSLYRTPNPWEIYCFHEKVKMELCFTNNIYTLQVKIIPEWGRTGKNVHHPNQNRNPVSMQIQWKYSPIFKKQDNEAKTFFTCLSGKVHLYLKTLLKLFRYYLSSWYSHCPSSYHSLR